MKRTCNNCRALSGELCDLGFMNKVRPSTGLPGGRETDHSGFFMGMKPVEECPKPLTYAAWFELREAK